MKRVWRIGVSIGNQSEIMFLQRSLSRCKSFRPAIFAFPNREASTEARSPERDPFLGVIGLFGVKIYCGRAMEKENMEKKVLQLRDELLSCGGESEEVVRVLEEKGKPLFLSYANGAACVELLKVLLPQSRLALEVFDWRKKLGEYGLRMTSEEYAKGITIAGRTARVDLALEWFTEATNKRIKTTSTYNALMGAYMWNGLTNKCQSVFKDLKKDADCVPSVVTYNILISLYNRLMLVDQMEAAFQEMKDANISPTLKTYNNLIGGYVTAWMWDRMEKTFLRINASPMKPDLNTYLLMLRGYAHSGNLERMEEIYKLVKHDVNPTLIRAIICAYVKSSRPDRLERVHTFVKLLPEKEYRPWLNVLLMSAYAQETWLEKMESSINEAFERRIRVHALHVMRLIGASYFRCKAVDRLSDFVKRAESAGWRVCRSLYHGMMVMYGEQGSLEDIANTLLRMKNSGIDPTRETYKIMVNAYSAQGETDEAQKMIGLMYKNGYRLPSDLHKF